MGSAAPVLLNGAAVSIARIAPDVKCVFRRTGRPATVRSGCPGCQEGLGLLKSLGGGDGRSVLRCAPHGVIEVR